MEQAAVCWAETPMPSGLALSARLGIGADTLTAEMGPENGSRLTLSKDRTEALLYYSCLI